MPKKRTANVEKDAPAPAKAIKKRKQGIKQVKLVKTIPDPERVLSPKYWDDMTSLQLSAQCKLLDIPASGKQTDKSDRLKTWYRNPPAFEKYEALRKMKAKKKAPTKPKKKADTSIDKEAV
jgi:hypothetical protein